MDIIAYLLALKKAKNYTDEQIAAIAKGMSYKGSVATKNDLPLEGNAKGDVYTVSGEHGQEYVWASDLSSGTLENWEILGGVDLTDYYTKEETEGRLEDVIDYIDEHGSQKQEEEITYLSTEIEEMKTQIIKIDGGDVE